MSKSPVNGDAQAQSFMIGVLVDVSDSMKEALAVDRSVSGNVERTHAIITTLNRIAKNAIDVHQQRHRMFVSAFGLEDISTCDLISLLKYISRYDSGQKASQLELESARKDRSEDNLVNHSLTSIMLKIAFGLSDPDGIS